MQRIPVRWSGPTLACRHPDRALLWAAAVSLVACPGPAAASDHAASSRDPGPTDRSAPSGTSPAPADTAAPAEAIVETAWTPHRLGFGGGALLAVWDWGASDPLFVWDTSGDTLGVIRVDYHYVATPGLAFGGALEVDAADTGAWPGYAGVALTAGLRVALWPDWVFVELETLVGYPWLVGGVASLGIAFPIDDGIWLRLDNRFLVALVDGSPFQAGWFPALAVELAL